MMKFLSLIYLALLLCTSNRIDAQKINKLKNENLKSEPSLLATSYKTSVNQMPLIDEKKEFHDLMQESSELHDKKTVKLLNNIFSNNKQKPESVLLVRNYSSCDIILRLQGKQRYNLAVPSKGENFISLKKDSYIIKGRVCNSEYLKTKDLTNSQIITLKYNELIKN